VAGIALGIYVRGICSVAPFTVDIFMLGTGVVVEMAVAAEFAVFRRCRRIPEGDVRMYKRRISCCIVAFLANYIYPQIFCWRMLMTIETCVRTNRKRMFGVVMAAAAIVCNHDMTTVTLITGIGRPALTGPRWYRM
jgi:hypothetical protein